MSIRWEADEAICSVYNDLVTFLPGSSRQPPQRRPLPSDWDAPWFIVEMPLFRSQTTAQSGKNTWSLQTHTEKSRGTQKDTETKTQWKYCFGWGGFPEGIFIYPYCTNASYIIVVLILYWGYYLYLHISLSVLAVVSLFVSQFLFVFVSALY